MGSLLPEHYWVSRIGHGQTNITVVVKLPEVENAVRMRDFEPWLKSNGRSPAEKSLKTRLRGLLGKSDRDGLRLDSAEIRSGPSEWEEFFPIQKAGQ